MCVVENVNNTNREHPFLNKLPSEEEIQKRIASKYNSLTYEGENGKRKPFVCLFCDEFLWKDKDLNNMTLQSIKKVRSIFLWSQVEDSRRTEELESYYQWNGVRNGCTDDLEFLKGMALSPRATLEKRTGQGSRGHVFKCCHRCKLNTTRGKSRFLPRHSILNRNYVGGTPLYLQTSMGVTTSPLASKSTAPEAPS